MKKTIILFGALIYLIFGANSCGDSFLSSTPTVDIPDNEFFISEEKMFNSLTAAYQPLLWHDWAFGQYNPIMILGDVMSDDLFPGGANEFDNEHWHRMHKFNANSDLTPSSLWLVAYSGVNRSNIVINNIDNVSGVSEAAKKRMYAEALTLRAYYNHLLWKFWGNIPYYETNPTEPPFLVDQIAADEVYKKIVSDLDTAIKEGNLDMKIPASRPGELGRVTKATAQMLKANVVMYQNDESKYGEVLTDLREIINSEQYQLYPNFAQLWEDEGEWSSETIFDANYSDDAGGGRGWATNDEPNKPLYPGGTVIPTLIGINGLSGSNDYNEGWGFGNISKETYDLYNDKDTRKDGGILNFEKHKESNPSASYKPRYQDTGYFLKKYLPRKDGNSNATGDIMLNYRNNYRIFRYAETLLLASELLVRTGGSQTDADLYLNMVRARAYDMDINDADFKPYKKVANLDNILQELRLEFVGEGHRFWDLVRYGKAEQVLGSRGYTANKKYLPIPKGEIDKAQGTLTQNNY